LISHDPARFVFLGASNLARGHRALAQCLESVLQPQSSEFFFALGPGRAYRANGGILFHRYDSIETCGVLERAGRDIDRTSSLTVLLTDIGNDIMYGVPVEELIECLEGILQKLGDLEADIHVSPISSWLERQLDPVRFNILKALFYPKSGMTYPSTIDALIRINRYIRTEIRATIIEGLDAFVGLDKIHYSFFRSGSAWTRVAKSLAGKVSETKLHPICFSKMMESYGKHYRQLIFNDMMGLELCSTSYF
tara:strand:+ start:336 stop:1088 length:753 start_codon:yes stop_codon:yes gene_type:complete